MMMMMMITIIIIYGVIKHNKTIQCVI
jgi:hypothetical protein